MSPKMLRPFIVKVSVLGYFPLYIYSLLLSICFLYTGYYYQGHVFAITHELFITIIIVIVIILKHIREYRSLLYVCIINHYHHIL